MKWCNDCKRNLPFSCFSKSKKNTTLGLKSYCRECSNARYNEWFGENKEYARAQARKNAKKRYSTSEGREKIRRQRISCMFGLPPDTYDMMVWDQAALCAICRGLCPSGKNLSVDHCHKTGKARGLLCQHCNHGLGKFKDDIELMKKAINYLRKSRKAA